MSTKKSLLTYESVKDSLNKVDTYFNGVVVPIGVSPTGALEVVRLENSPGANMLIYGICGSGKSKYVEFIIRSLIDLYGNRLIISYIDCMDCEIQQWIKTDKHECRIPNPRLLTSCETKWEFDRIICDLDARINSKHFTEVELVVVDQFGKYMLDNGDTDTIRHFNEVLAKGPKNGVHFLITSQTPKEITDVNVNYSSACDLICTTRVSEEISKKLYGNTIGTNVRKYGDVVYDYKGNQSKLRVPFVSSWY